MAGGGGATADADLASAVRPPQAPAGLSQRHQLPCGVRVWKLPPAGQGCGGVGGGWLPVSLNPKVPREGSVWVLDKRAPARGSAGAPLPQGVTREGPLDPPAPAGAPPSWPGALTQHHVVPSFHTAQHCAGRPDRLQAACQLCCHHPGARAESPDQTGKGHSWWGKGAMCRKCFLRTEVTEKDRKKIEGTQPGRGGHTQEKPGSWLAAAPSRPRAPATPRRPPSPLQTPSPVFIWPAES